MKSLRSNLNRGFTIIEIIIALVVSSIILVMASILFSHPFDIYGLIRNKTKTTSDSITFSNKFTNDTKAIVAGSVRIINNDGVCVEFMPEKLKAKYGNIVSNYFSPSDARDSVTALIDSSTLTKGQIIASGDYLSIYSESGLSDLYAEVGSHYSATTTVADVADISVVNQAGNEDHKNTLISITPNYFASAGADGMFSITPQRTPVLGYACLSMGIDKGGTGNGRIVRYVQSLPRVAPASCQEAVKNALNLQEVVSSISDCKIELVSISASSATAKKLTLRATVSTKFDNTLIEGSARVFGASVGSSGGTCLAKGCQFGVMSNDPYCVANCGSTEGCSLHDCPVAGSLSFDSFCTANCGAKTCTELGCPAAGGFSTSAFCKANCGTQDCSDIGCKTPNKIYPDGGVCVTSCGAPSCAQSCPTAMTTDTACVNQCGRTYDQCKAYSCPVSVVDDGLGTYDLCVSMKCTTRSYPALPECSI